MTTAYHTPLANGDPATAATFNLPLSALDTAIGNTQTASAITGGTIDGTVIGGTTPALGVFSPQITVRAEATSSLIIARSASDSTSTSNVRQSIRSRGTLDSQSPVLSGDWLMSDQVYAWHGSGNGVAAYWVYVATENWSATNQGTTAILNITKSGTASPVQQIAIDDNGLDVADAVRGSCLRADGDPGGVASTTTFTSATGTPTDTANPSSWIKAYVGTQAGYIPFHNA